MIYLIKYWRELLIAALAALICGWFFFRGVDHCEASNKAAAEKAAAAQKIVDQSVTDSLKKQAEDYKKQAKDNQDEADRENADNIKNIDALEVERRKNKLAVDCILSVGRLRAYNSAGQAK